MGDSTTRSYLWLFAALAALGLVLDQASKYVVFAKLYPDDDVIKTQVDIIPGAFSLTTYYTNERDPGGDSLSFLRTLSGERLPTVNRGALFGIGGSGEGMNSFFATVSVLAACVIVLFVARPSVAADCWLCVALGLILGGTLGNLYDRIVFGGVRDFFDWYLWFKWADFNVADGCLVCGAGVLLLHSLLMPDKSEETTKPATAAAAAPVEAGSARELS